MKSKFQEYLEGLKEKRDMSGPSYDTRNKKGHDEIDDEVLSKIMSKREKMLRYVKNQTKGDPNKHRDNVKRALNDFAYENNIDIDDVTADYIVDSVIMTESKEEIDKDKIHKSHLDGPSTEDAIEAVCRDIHDSIGDHFPSDDEEFIFNSIVKHYRKNYLR